MWHQLSQAVSIPGTEGTLAVARLHIRLPPIVSSGNVVTGESGQQRQALSP